jgi:aminoglycoside phosphotransferase (APT) family kinase protein
MVSLLVDFRRGCCIDSYREFVWPFKGIGTVSYTALYQTDPTNGPLPGTHNFHRGGALHIYDSQVRQSLNILKGRVDTHLIAQVWEEALASTWVSPPVWVHGDISAGNLLVEKGELKSVIDFGMMAIGDPACDLAIAWTFFKGESRRLFQQEFSIDPDTWRRACGWALWKALIIAADFTSNPRGTDSPWTIIEDILEDRRLEEGKEI